MTSLGQRAPAYTRAGPPSTITAAQKKHAGKVAGTERIAVMAALNIAHELLSMRLGEGFDVGEARRRIVDIEAKLEAALAKQEKLF